MPTSEPDPTTSPEVPSTSRPDDDEVDNRAEGYKSGCRDGHEIGYHVGKAAYWRSLLICLGCHRSEKKKAEADAILECLRCVLRIERCTEEELKDYVKTAKKHVTDDEIKRLIEEVCQEKKTKG